LPFDSCFGHRTVEKGEPDKIIAKIRRVAKERGLVVSGGGDFHTDDNPQRIGDYGLSEEEFNELKKFWKNKYGN